MLNFSCEWDLTRWFLCLGRCPEKRIRFVCYCSTLVRTGILVVPRNVCPRLLLYSPLTFILRWHFLYIYIISLEITRLTLPALLQQSFHFFSTCFSSLQVVHSSRLAQLNAQKLQTKIHHGYWQRNQICAEVKKPENKYEAASTLLGSGQIHLLWQIWLGRGGRPVMMRSIA